MASNPIPVSRAEVFWYLADTGDGTAQEIADAIGLAQKTVQDHLLALSKAGIVVSCRRPKRYRPSRKLPSEYLKQLQDLEFFARRSWVLRGVKRDQDQWQGNALVDLGITMTDLIRNSVPVISFDFERVEREVNVHVSYGDLVQILGRAAGYINIATCTYDVLEPPDLHYGSYPEERDAEIPVTFLFSTNEAAQQVAWTLRGKWDGLNAITLHEYDEAAIETAANLAMTEYCGVGQQCCLSRAGKSDAISRMVIKAFYEREWQWLDSLSPCQRHCSTEI